MRLETMRGMPILLLELAVVGCSNRAGDDVLQESLKGTLVDFERLESKPVYPTLLRMTILRDRSFRFVSHCASSGQPLSVPCTDTGPCDGTGLSSGGAKCGEVTQSDVEELEDRLSASMVSIYRQSTFDVSSGVDYSVQRTVYVRGEWGNLMFLADQVEESTTRDLLERLTEVQRAYYQTATPCQAEDAQLLEAETCASP